jgi:hypothetical protein
MEATYDNIKDFMKRYFADFTAYAQNPLTLSKMHTYLVSELECVSFIPGVALISSREEFLHLMSSHPSSRERLTPEEIIIDEKQMIAVVLARTEILDSITGELLVTQKLLPFYHLTFEDSSIKIKQILIFGEGFKSGSITISDIFKKDPQMNRFFAK